MSDDLIRSEALDVSSGFDSDVEVTGDGLSLVIALGTGPTDGATVAALRLADAAAQRGHRVTVYAYGEAVRVGAEGCPTSSYVSCLVGDSREDTDAGDRTDAAGRNDDAGATDSADRIDAADRTDDEGATDAAHGAADADADDAGAAGSGEASTRRISWIVDAHDPRTSPQVPGVVRGDGSHLWRSVRDGDVVLGVTA